ncbi:MAG: hypothetical protein ACI4VL_06155 [Bacilli bacterium]
MKNTKKVLGVFVIMVCALFLVPNCVDALENHEDLIKKIAPDGENAVFKVKKPTSIEEGDVLINGYVNNLLQVEGYEITAGCYEAPYTSCTVSIRTDDYDSTWENGEEVVVSGWKGLYTINVTYDEPKSNSVLNDYFGKLNNFSESNPNTYYFVEDLSLINYYLTSDKSELWNPGAPGRALKYSTLNNVTNGSNVTYYIDVRAGMQNETLMYESAFGPMSIFYNGYSYGTKEEGIYLKRVIYIPQDTENTKEDFVKAAQKRINDYLGNSSVVVSYGGLLSSLPEGSEDASLPIDNDGNYYNIKIGDRTYKFYIIKGNDEQLVEPTYIGLDLDSKIEITSKDSSIPLDTSVTVNSIYDSSIKDIIGTENYKSYDISLYSDAKNAKIEKLENGKFLVKIPVPTELSGKDLIVYYITSEGAKEEHEVTVKDDYAIFETDHFSVYSLAEKENVENPKTYDGIINIILVGIISLIGLVGATIYLKKKK